MFGRRLGLVRLLGFEIRFDLTWLIVVALIVLTLSTGYFPAAYADLPTSTYVWMGVLGALGLFASIVIHELAHSIVGRRLGMEFHGITLFAFGGAAELREEPATPRVEFLMTIAGPLTSVVLGVLFTIVAVAMAALGIAEPIVAVLAYLGAINFMLALFNLLPAFPLDGGRILRAALWAWRGDVLWATRVATLVGGGLGLGLIFLGILNALSGNILGGTWWFLIGLFIRASASAAYQRLVTRHGLAGVPVRRLMRADIVSVTPDLTADRLVEDYLLGRAMKRLPVVDNGRFVGSVGVDEVRLIPPAERAGRRVGEILVPPDPQAITSPVAESMAAMEQMERTGRNSLFVLDGERLVGLLLHKDVLQYLRLAADLRPPPKGVPASAQPAE